MKLAKLLAPLALGYSSSIFAWTDHSAITQHILSAKSGVNFDVTQNVTVTPLSNFVLKNQMQITQILTNSEEWAKQQIPAYAKTPSNIIFNPKDKQCQQNLSACFIQAIRINPNVPLLPIAYDPDDQLKIGTPIKKINELMLPGEKIEILNQLLDNKMKLLNNGDIVPLSAVISANANIPDFGLDIGLYDNDSTIFGKKYGFGKQPIGEASVPWSSQILFHMSTYYVHNIFFKFKPKMKSSYPEYRFHVYASLAQLAYQQHETYWAGVFAGWAIHYVQDMTQPYHGYLYPGYATIRVLLVSALQPIYSWPYHKMEYNIIARHELAENTAGYLLNTPGSAGSELAKALANTSLDNQVPRCTLTTPYVKDVVNYNSYQMTQDFSYHLVKDFPRELTSQGNIFQSDKAKWNDLYNNMTTSKKNDYIGTLEERYLHMGAYSRSCLNLIFAK